MGTTRVNFRIPEELIQKADIAATVTDKNRTELVTEALREYLAEIEDEEPFAEAVIDLYVNSLGRGGPRLLLVPSAVR